MAIVAGVAVLLLVLVIGAVVLVNQSGGSSTPTAATPTPTPAVTPSGATTPPSTTPTPAGPSLSTVFPDVAGSTCVTASPPARTRSGISATESYVCDFSSAAPDARVVFARWADAAGAQAWYQDTENLGPRIENFDNWQSGGVRQGPLYTAEADGTVYSTGIYDGLNYSWEIRTTTLAESNAVFEQIQFRPRTAIGG